jgi:hypothetical protein
VIGLPRPRDLESLFAPEFSEVVHELRNHIGYARH